MLMCTRGVKASGINSAILPTVSAYQLKLMLSMKLNR